MVIDYGLVLKERLISMKYLYETHLHTSKVSACASCSPAEQVRAYKDRGYAGIIVTDHFINGNSTCPKDLPWDEKMIFFSSGYREAQQEGALCGFDVFFGWEYCREGTEFLTYGLSLEFLLAHPDLDKISISEYSALVRKNGGYLAQAHPYRHDPWVKNSFPVDAGLMDGIEVYNASMPAEVNAKALDFARLHQLPQQAGSDSHHSNLSFASGIALNHKARSIFDIIAAIKSKNTELIVPDNYI